MPPSRESQDEVQARLFCNRRRVRLSLLFFGAFFLPVHLCLMVYCIHVRYDRRNGAYDYSSIGGTVFCNSMWCLESEEAASYLFGAGAFLPLLYVLTMSQYLLLRVTYRAYMGYMADRKRECHEWLRARRRHLWEMPLERKERRVRELLEGQARVSLEQARFRPKSRRIGCYRVLRAYCCRRQLPRVLDAVVYFLFRDRIVTVAQVLHGVALLACVVVPLAIFLPLVLTDNLTIHLSLSHEGETRLSVALFVVIPSFLSAVYLTYKAVRLAARIRRKLQEARQLLQQQSRGDEDEDATTGEEDELAPQYDVATRVGIFFDDRLGVRRPGMVAALVGYFGFVLPLTLGIAATSSGLLFVQSSFDDVSNRLVTVYLTAFLPATYFWVLLLRTSVERRFPLSFDPHRKVDDMSKLRLIARRAGLPEWRAGEYPDFSVGYLVVTDGIRPKRSPYLHKGHRFSARGLRSATSLLFLVPLAVVLPLQQHLPQAWLALDRHLKIPDGTTGGILLQIVALYAGGSAFLAATWLVVGAMPRPTRAALPYGASWLFVCGMLPLLLYFGTSAAPLGAQRAAFRSCLLLSALFSGVVLCILAARWHRAVWSWLHSLRLEPILRDRVARFGARLAALTSLAMPALLVWVFVMLLSWPALGNENLLYIVAVFGIVTSLVNGVTVTWTFVSLVYFDFLDPRTGINRLLPAMLLLSICGTLNTAIGVQADYVPGYGGMDLGTAFFQLRGLGTACAVQVALLILQALDIRKFYKRRDRFGYHPELWELWNPVLSIHPEEDGSRGYEREKAEEDWHSEDEEANPAPDMTVSDRCAALRKSLMFRYMPERTLWACAARMERRSAERGRVIVAAGEESPYILLVERGYVSELSYFTAADQRLLPPGITPQSIASLRRTFTDASTPSLVALHQLTSRGTASDATAPARIALPPESDTGFERVLRMHAPGDVIGDIDYLSNRKGPQAMFVAESPVDMLILPVVAVHDLVKDETLSPAALELLERARVQRRGEIRAKEDADGGRDALNAALAELMEENEDLEDGFVYERPTLGKQAEVESASDSDW